MLNRKTLALSFAAVLISASAAMAATTHHHHRTVTHHAARNTDSRLSYGEAIRSQSAGGPYYYEPSVNGSAWSYYPGYTSH